MRHTNEDVTRAAVGDAEAFGRLYEVSCRRVWAFAVRHGSGRTDAEALTVQVLSQAFRTLARHADDAAFAAHLLALCRQAVDDRAAGRAVAR